MLSFLFFFSRQIHAQLKNPDHRHSSRLLAESSVKNPLKIGIIGCGRLGSHLVNTFLAFGDVGAENIKVSTRRPETLSMYWKEDLFNSLRMITLASVTVIIVLSRHRKNFWAFTGPRPWFCWYQTCMVIHRSFSGPTHLLSANVGGPVSFAVSV